MKNDNPLEKAVHIFSVAYIYGQNLSNQFFSPGISDFNFI